MRCPKKSGFYARIFRNLSGHNMPIAFRQITMTMRPVGMARVDLSRPLKNPNPACAGRSGYLLKISFDKAKH
jgi:hypothetical protein